MAEKRAAAAAGRVSDLVEEIRSVPTGPHVGAFFDFDGTIIDGYSYTTFTKQSIRSGQFSPRDAAQSLVLGLRGVTSEEDFARFTALGLQSWAGRSLDELDELGERLFRQEIAARLYPEAWTLVQTHLGQGHTVVIASSATRFQVEPAARAMGVEHVLCTNLEEVDGILTGEVVGTTLWRAGKARAVLDFAAANGIDLDASFAYSNGTEDVPFLETVGHPRPLNPEKKLAEVAAKHGWPVHRFTPRGMPGIGQVTRSLAAIGGLMGGFVTGATIGTVNGNHRSAVDLGTQLGVDLFLALAGIEVDVVGEANLWERRPAVFIFNHRSSLDAPLMAYLLRRRFVGVAKKELASDPIMGPAFRFADTAFVDRANSTKARQALQPAVDRLQRGLSVIIAPEGTRTVTPRLGTFKKGAFHMAIQAGVPIVPVVIRNAGELMWKSNKTTKSGRLQVAVLPPIDVSSWRVEDLNEHVAQVRQLYADTLADWPSDHPVASQPAGEPA